jgi:general secretion pathway protein K
MHKAPRLQQRGVALILVLMLTAVIAVVVIVMQYKARAAVTLARQAQEFTQARANIESAREELIYILTTTPVWLSGGAAAQLEQQQLPLEFNLYGRIFNWKGVEFRLTDTSGKLALIPFNEVSWRKLLESQGMKSADPVIDAIKDWIDEDDLTHLYGAEASDYDQIGMPRNQQPQFEEEFHYVKGMPPELWAELKPFLTLIGYELPNPYFMPDDMLPVMLGPLTADMLKQERISQNFSGELASILRVDEETFFPSKRLAVELRAKVGESAYAESFELIREPGADRISHITKKQPGFEWPVVELETKSE